MTSIASGEHLVAFLTGPVILFLLLLLSGGFRRTAKRDSYHRALGHHHTHFTSRYGGRLSSHAHALVPICLMAMLAECFNTVVTPDCGLLFGVVELQGTLLNLAGAALAGLASALEEHGGVRASLAGAFKGGFLAASMSFVFFVEHAAQLVANDARHGSVELSAPYLVLCIMTAPVLFAAGRRAGLALAQPPKKKLPLVPVTDPAMLQAMAAVAGLIVLAVSREAATGGTGAALALVVGCGATAAAFVAGELIAHAVEVELAYAVQESEINWATAVANAVALVLVSWIHTGRRTPVYRRVFAGPAADTLLDKLAGSFCGGLSGFGAFAEDVAQSAREHEMDGAIANVGVNCLVALSFSAFLQPILGGFLD